MAAAARRPNAGTLRRWFGVGLVLVVTGVLAHQARRIDWPAVGSALQAYDAATLAGAAALTALSHLLYGCFDLIGRRLTGHRVGTRRVLAFGATAYAVSLNLGALIGGFATRYRLYGAAGLPLAQTSQVIAVAITTNWFGYLAVAGALLAVQPPAMPPDWVLDGTRLRWVGVAMLALAAGYLVACTFGPRRVWRWRGHALTTPSVGEALLQLVLSAANWIVIATLVWVVLQRQVDWPSVAATLAIAVFAGLIVRVPAGVGVLETVFVALLSHRVPLPALLAGLLVYRAVYYLGPLAVAGATLLVLGRAAASAPPKPASPAPPSPATTSPASASSTTTSPTSASSTTTSPTSVSSASASAAAAPPAPAPNAPVPPGRRPRAPNLAAPRGSKL
jgi:uncharacterized membrane protein YbhN (UPF0104 family)